MGMGVWKRWLTQRNSHGYAVISVYGAPEFVVLEGLSRDEQGGAEVGALICFDCEGGAAAQVNGWKSLDFTFGPGVVHCSIFGRPQLPSFQYRKVGYTYPPFGSRSVPIFHLHCPDTHLWLRSGALGIRLRQPGPLEVSSRIGSIFVLQQVHTKTRPKTCLTDYVLVLPSLSLAWKALSSGRT